MQRHSIDVENIAVAHPAVAMAACIGVKHPKWDERPIVVVAKKPGAELTKEELLRFYEGKTAKWQIPDDVVFVDAIPLGATGKMLKTKLREMLKDYRRVHRWEDAMPQYEVGHLGRVDAITDTLSQTPGVLVAGAGYGGLGLPIIDTALILEEIAKVDYVTAMAVLGEAGVQTRVIARYAPEVAVLDATRS